MDTSNEARWYVVHTYSGYENKVATDLNRVVENRGIQDMIQDVRVPTETVVEVVPATKSKKADFDYSKDEKAEATKTREVERKLFPGYVFVKMVLTTDTWFIVRNIRGCTGFVGADPKNPAPLSAEEVDRLGVEGKKVYDLPYEIGDSVKIVSGGRMEGHILTVTDIDIEKGKVTGVIFGGSAFSVEVDLVHVVPID